MQHKWKKYTSERMLRLVEEAIKAGVEEAVIVCGFGLGGYSMVDRHGHLPCI